MNDILDIMIYESFQFQYGAIKRGRILTFFLCTQSFQFQYGAIKRVILFDTEGNEHIISIPIWCD